MTPEVARNVACPMCRYDRFELVARRADRVVVRCRRCACKLVAISPDGFELGKFGDFRFGKSQNFA